MQRTATPLTPVRFRPQPPFSLYYLLVCRHTQLLCVFLYLEYLCYCEECFLAIKFNLCLSLTSQKLFISAQEVVGFMIAYFYHTSSQRRYKLTVMANKDQGAVIGL